MAETQKDVLDTAQKTDQEKLSSGTLHAAVDRLKAAFIIWQDMTQNQSVEFADDASMIDVVEAVAQSLENAI